MLTCYHNRSIDLASRPGSRMVVATKTVVSKKNIKSPIAILFLWKWVQFLYLVSSQEIRMSIITSMLQALAQTPQEWWMSKGRWYGKILLHVCHYNVLGFSLPFFPWNAFVVSAIFMNLTNERWWWFMEQRNSDYRGIKMPNWSAEKITRAAWGVL